MVSQELIDKISGFLSEGYSRDEIKEYLVSEGWQEGAVDEALNSVQKPQSFWQFHPLYPYFAALDAKTAQLPPRVIWIISGAMIMLVLIVGLILYLVMNPATSSVDSRDHERDEAQMKLRTGLERFYTNYSVYPQSLSELIPEYLDSMPFDPKLNKPYDYTVTDDRRSYNLCIYFEGKRAAEACLSPLNVDPSGENSPEDYKLF